jgi:ABC-2 type transport system permease protein
VARLLVQLKLRLLRNALRSSTQAKVSFVVSTTFAGLVAVGTFAGLAALRGNSASVDLTTVVFTLFAFGWLILPLLAFGLDGTLDPATLALYPLRTRPLAVGLLAASATGAWPLANLIGLLGVTVGLARGGLGLFIALLAVLLEVLFCITLARFVTAGLAGLLRSRRGKDLAAFLIIPIFALYEVFTQVVPKLTAEGKLTPASFAGVDVWMRWIPPGLAAHAIQDASNGHPGTALLRLALLAAVILVLGRLWIGSLSRGLVTVDTSTQSSAVRGAALPFGRYGLRGTVAARFWIYQRREPSSIIYWCITAVVMIAVSVSTILTPRYLGGLLGSAALGAALLAVLHSDSIGMSGPSFGLEAMALAGRRSLRAYFSGQNIALGMIAVPLLTVVSFGLAAVAKHPVDGFLGMAVALAGIGAGLALGSVFTVTTPYPVEKRVGSPTPRPADGYMGYRLAGTLAASSARWWRSSRSCSARCSLARIRRWCGCRCSCCAPPDTVSRWRGAACGSLPARPSRGCRTSTRSLSAASSSRLRTPTSPSWLRDSRAEPRARARCGERRGRATCRRGRPHAPRLARDALASGRRQCAGHGQAMPP